MAPMEFRELDITERPLVNAFYQKTTYKRQVSPHDRVFVAINAGTILGATRIELADNVQVLRGMYMHPEHIRLGIGSRLLRHVEPVLGQSPSYCIPADHLLDFYGKVGFTVIAPEKAPGFLASRHETYSREGKSVAIMYRPPG